MGRALHRTRWSSRGKASGEGGALAPSSCCRTKDPSPSTVPGPPRAPTRPAPATSSLLAADLNPRPQPTFAATQRQAPNSTHRKPPTALSALRGAHLPPPFITTPCSGDPHIIINIRCPRAPASCIYFAPNPRRPSPQPPARQHGCPCPHSTIWPTAHPTQVSHPKHLAQRNVA